MTVSYLGIEEIYFFYHRRDIPDEQCKAQNCTSLINLTKNSLKKNIYFIQKMSKTDKVLDFPYYKLHSYTQHDYI